MTNLFTTKQIINAIKLFRNNGTVLPILETVALNKEEIMLHDLETCISIPFKTGMTGCVYSPDFIAALETFKTPEYKAAPQLIIMAEGKTTVKLGTEELGNFPKMIDHENEDKTEPAGTIPAEMLPTLEDTLEYLSNDELRPALTVVSVTTHIVATDAHRLLFIKLETPFTTQILLNKKAIRLMLIFGGNWTISEKLNKHKDHIITTTNEAGIKIIHKHGISKYPEWQAVVPKVDKKSSFATFDREELKNAIKNGSRFANNITNMGILKFHDGKLTYSTSDIDFNKEFSTEIGAKFTEQIELAFNFKFLNSFINKCGKEVKMHYSTPTTGVIIDGKYLLMPLMLNQ